MEPGLLCSSLHRFIFPLCLLSPHFFKKASGILQSPQSLRLSVPSRYLHLNHRMKFNQIWCVSCSNEQGVQPHIYFWPRPLGPWGGAKRSNMIKYQLQSQFQRFLNQTLCVFSQMKDITHIRRDYHSVTWVMPQGLDLGVPRGVERSNNFFPRNSTRFGV